MVRMLVTAAPRVATAERLSLSNPAVKINIAPGVNIPERNVVAIQTALSAFHALKLVVDKFNPSGNDTRGLIAEAKPFFVNVVQLKNDVDTLLNGNPPEDVELAEIQSRLDNIFASSGKTKFRRFQVNINSEQEWRGFIDVLGEVKHDWMQPVTSGYANAGLLERRLSRLSRPDPENIVEATDRLRDSLNQAEQTVSAWNFLLSLPDLTPRDRRMFAGDIVRSRRERDIRDRQLSQAQTVTSDYDLAQSILEKTQMITSGISRMKEFSNDLWEALGLEVKNVQLNSKSVGELILRFFPGVIPQVEQGADLVKFKWSKLNLFRILTNVSQNFAKAYSLRLKSVISSEKANWERTHGINGFIAKPRIFFSSAQGDNKDYAVLTIEDSGPGFPIGLLDGNILGDGGWGKGIESTRKGLKGVVRVMRERRGIYRNYNLVLVNGEAKKIYSISDYPTGFNPEDPETFPVILGAGQEFWFPIHQPRRGSN